MNPSSARQKPLVSVVIPVFNKCELTAQCLDAIVKVGALASFELIVVDNASSDATAQVLAHFGSYARIIRNDKNLGFAVACNQGAAAAAGTYVLFLNNDTIPLPGWLDALVDELDHHPEVVAVGSKLLYQDGLVQHAGVAFDRETRSPYHPHRLLRADDPRVNRRRELQAVTAACIMIRSQWFFDCGRFCEQFQTGYEDVDLCLTIRRRGGVIVYQPKSVLFHLEGQSPGRMRNESRNRALLFARWSDQLLCDDDDYYFADDLRILRGRDELGEFARFVRFESPEERSRWSVVAECQRSAAAGRREQMKICLTRSDAWPIEAAVRRWAGALCHRLGERGAAMKHFAAALSLEPTPELRAHVALHDGEGCPPGPAGAAWESCLVEGLRRLGAGQLDRARAELETALCRGAPPELVLPGLCDEASRSGSTAEESLRSAVLGLPHVDPTTAEQLKSDQV